MLPSSDKKHLICWIPYIELFSWFCAFSASFSCFTADQFCSQEPPYTCECFIPPVWLRIAWSKRSNSLGASCLKTEAQPAAESYCLSVYISVTRWTVQMKKVAFVCYIHQPNLMVSNCRILSFHLPWYKMIENLCRTFVQVNEMFNTSRVPSPRRLAYRLLSVVSFRSKAYYTLRPWRQNCVFSLTVLTVLPEWCCM